MRRRLPGLEAELARPRNPDAVELVESFGALGSLQSFQGAEETGRRERIPDGAKAGGATGRI
jgi:hypothetical protein